MIMHMTKALTRTLMGAAIAVVIVGLAVTVPTLAGISTWKWMLALIGLLIWFYARVDAVFRGRRE